MIKIHLSKLLGERKMTQKELADITGIRPNTISLYYNETIQRINVNDLDKICKALNCRIQELIEYIPDNEENDDISVFIEAEDDLTEEDIKFIKETIQKLKRKNK